MPTIVFRPFVIILYAGRFERKSESPLDTVRDVVLHFCEVRVVFFICALS